MVDIHRMPERTLVDMLNRDLSVLDTLDHTETDQIALALMLRGTRNYLIWKYGSLTEIVNRVNSFVESKVSEELAYCLAITEDEAAIIAAECRLLFSDFMHQVHLSQLRHRPYMPLPRRRLPGSIVHHVKDALDAVSQFLCSNYEEQAYEDFRQRED